MSIDRFENEGHRLPDDVRFAMRDWLSQHGIDPHDVPVAGWIERHPDDRQILYSAYDKHDDGSYHWTPVDDPDQVPPAESVAMSREEKVGDTFRTSAVLLLVPKVVQLESPPAPFPACASTWLDTAD